MSKKVVWLLCGISLLFGLFACRANSQTAPTETPMPTQNEIFRVESNTQLEYKNLLIGVAGIWQEEYTDSTGAARNGVTTGLWVYVKDNRPLDQFLRAYVGQEFTVEQYTISVMDIEQGSNKPIVTLKISEP